MKPGKHVEIKPQMAQHNSADNTGLDCCWSTKTRYIHFSLNFLYFCLSYSRRSHNSRGNDRRWNLRNNRILSDPFWPMRIKLEQSKSYYFARKLPLRTDSFPRLMNLVSSRKLRLFVIRQIQRNKDTLSPCYRVPNSRNNIYTWQRKGESFSTLAINFRKKIRGKPYVTYGTIELTTWTSNFSIN